MSYILDALKKSDAERKRGEVPTLNSASENQKYDPATAKRFLPLILVGIFVMVAVIGFGAKFALLKTPVTVQDVKYVKPVKADEPVAIKKPVAKIIKPLVEEIKTPIAKPIAQHIAQPAPPPLAEPPAKPLRVYTPKPIVTTGLPPLTSAVAYVNRAWESIDNGLYAQAIHDLDQALLIEPSYGAAWFAKGWANEKNGREKQAIGNYDRAIEANPNNAVALFSRGFLKLYNKDALGAVVDFVRTQGVATDESLKQYSKLWVYISHLRSGQDLITSRKSLSTTANSANITWPNPMLNFVRGKMDENQLLKSIKGEGAKGLQERQVTGYFFLGLTQQRLGHFANAQRFFEMALASGGVQFRQYDAARRELKILNKRANKPKNTPNG